MFSPSDKRRSNFELKISKIEDERNAVERSKSEDGRTTVGQESGSDGRWTQRDDSEAGRDGVELVCGKLESGVRRTQTSKVK
jgi:hypothetical protein